MYLSFVLKKNVVLLSVSSTLLFSFLICTFCLLQSGWFWSFSSQLIEFHQLRLKCFTCRKQRASNGKCMRNCNFAFLKKKIVQWTICTYLTPRIKIKRKVYSCIHFLSRKEMRQLSLFKVWHFEASYWTSYFIFVQGKSGMETTHSMNSRSDVRKYKP